MILLITPVFLLSWAQAKDHCVSFFDGNGNSLSNKVFTILPPEANSLSKEDRFALLLSFLRAGFNRERLLRALPEIIELSGKFLKSQGLTIEKVSLPVDTDLMVPAWLIKPMLEPSAHPLNLFAGQVEKSHFGLQIVYNPYLLIYYQAEAAFSEVANQIAIPNGMILDAQPNSAFAHEMTHADEFRKRLNGEKSPYHGVIKVIEGKSLNSVYKRNMTFEEILTAAEYVFRKAKEILITINSQHISTIGPVKSEEMKQRVTALFVGVVTAYSIIDQMPDYLSSALEFLESPTNEVHFKEQILSTPRFSKSKQIVGSQFEFQLKKSEQNYISGVQTQNLEIAIPLVTEFDLKQWNLGNKLYLNRRISKHLSSLLKLSNEYRRILLRLKSNFPYNGSGELLDYEKIGWPEFLKEVDLFCSEIIRLQSPL